jgi:hypothetical protein
MTNQAWDSAAEVPHNHVPTEKRPLVATVNVFDEELMRSTPFLSTEHLSVSERTETSYERAKAIALSAGMFDFYIQHCA